ncbi:MAG TPA: vWA domain-containing protein [Lacipirellulaceae bacterium]
MTETFAPADRAAWFRLGWLGDLNSFLVSTAVHLVAFVGIGLLSLSAQHGFEHGELVVQLGSGNDAVVGDEGRLAGVADATLSATEAATTAVQSPAELLTPQAITSTAVDSVASQLTPASLADAEMSPAAKSIGVDDASAAKAIDRALAAKSGLGGRGLGLRGDGKDAHSGHGSPWGSESGFYGLGSDGQSLVYIVDCSDSMNENHKFQHATAELIRTLKSLSNKQKFFVIFFNNGAFPMDADGPVDATAQNIDDLRRWLQYVAPGGGTDPMPALTYALSLKPDAIFLLSDGEFDPLVIDDLRAQNQVKDKPIPINTVSFYSREAIGIMKTIARQSGGKFQFVK